MTGESRLQSSKKIGDSDTLMVLYHLARCVKLVNLKVKDSFSNNSRDYNPEVFKLWVGTQTWVALAFSLGRGPFRDLNK